MPTIVTALDRDAVKDILIHTTGNVLLFGPPGTGKTSLVEWASHTRGQANLWMVNCTPDMSSGMIVGHPHIIPVMDPATGKPQYWAKGPAIQGWERGEYFLVDDLHMISSDAEAELLTLGNDPRTAHKVLPDGTIIRPAPGARMFATMNGLPTDINDALRDRFDKCILVRMPSTEMLDRLDTDVRGVCEQAYLNCDALAGALPTFSYRECKSFCQTRRELSAAITAGATTLPSDQEGLQNLAAELSLDGNPTRADGFMRLVKLAQATDPDE